MVLGQQDGMGRWHPDREPDDASARERVPAQASSLDGETTTRAHSGRWSPYSPTAQ
jgi:hypothetical protein